MGTLYTAAPFSAGDDGTYNGINKKLQTNAKTLFALFVYKSIIQPCDILTQRSTNSPDARAIPIRLTEPPSAKRRTGFAKQEKS